MMSRSEMVYGFKETPLYKMPIPQQHRHRSKTDIVYSMLKYIEKAQGNGVAITKLQMGSLLTAKQVKQYVIYLQEIGFIVKSVDNQRKKHPRTLYHTTKKSRKFMRLFNQMNENNLLTGVAILRT